jgi:hypothetical protein
MAGIAESCGFVAKPLLTKRATRTAVIKALKEASGKLMPGDIFLLSYSGHGGQLPDLNNDEETDSQDETWCLYNGELVDHLAPWTRRHHRMQRILPGKQTSSPYIHT